ncbi:hypothetical protein P2W68_13570 [Chryseobacterium arthrosphaerae]|uniref:hypothetical protein n=1 Tax=Chryseobacterium arthrosphaerae TaxID=651561 RepID=UPI0023E14759|nr:hypothetical protein [Chryseobacterium arthrosphaerae]WES95880.1 hypothetical protein P2W68_13570 [Chryseobacterium arthrosphaerae]
MTKTTILRLVLLAIVSTFLCSCIHDETLSTNSEVTFTSKEYHSKSLWKEDEVYIKNVKKIFETYADQNYFKDKAGEVAWDYTLTTGEENLLEVPVIRNGKVNFILIVEREADRIYFRRDSDTRSRSFFEILVFKDRKTLSGTIRENLKNSQAKSNCVTIEKTVTWTDTQTGAVLQVDHFTEMHCTSSGPKLPCEAIDMNSSCGGGSGTSGSGGGTGGGGGGGYPYPGDPESQQQFIDNCRTLKIQAINEDFKGKVAELNKSEIFNKAEETGYAAAYGPKTSYESLANTDNDNLKLPPGNKYFGYMHVHLNKEGVVKIFSPADIFTFLTSCVRNAKEKGTMEDAYAMVITSEGSYMLKYSGDGNYGIGPNTLASWQSWYDREYTNLFENSTMNQPNVEKLFAKFLKEKVKIEGLELFKTNTVAASAEKLTLGSHNNSVELIKCP